MILNPISHFGGSLTHFVYRTLYSIMDSKWIFNVFPYNFNERAHTFQPISSIFDLYVYLDIDLELGTYPLEMC